jgi:hypothetical protein
MKSRILTAIFLKLFLAIGASAQTEGDPENWCRNGLFPRENANYRIAKIKAAKGERVYFYGDDEADCPDNKNCRLKSYLINGDEVIVSRARGNFACGWFQPQKGSETVGWISSDKLEFVETASDAALNDWLGDWRYYDNSINIVSGKKRGLLEISGNAFWKGLGDNIHTGEIAGETAPRGNVLKIGENVAEEEDECKAVLRLVGNFLIVSDNLRCGGANVTFSGVYRRKNLRN